MRVFFDLDGVLCEFREKALMSDLYREGYFFTLKPHKNIVDAARLLSRDCEVYVMSAVLPDSPFALDEKNRWLDTHLPEITNRIFPHCGTAKASAVPGGIKPGDILVDDYGKNVRQWGRFANVIKVSRNHQDVLKEMAKHKHVISPDTHPAEIVGMVKGAAYE